MSVKRFLFTSKRSLITKKKSTYKNFVWGAHLNGCRPQIYPLGAAVCRLWSQTCISDFINLVVIVQVENFWAADFFLLFSYLVKTHPNHISSYEFYNMSKI